MTRLSLDLAAHICGVQPGTIRRWVHDGRVTRHWNGYDLDQLIAARDNRDFRKLLDRAGIRHADRGACAPKILV